MLWGGRGGEGWSAKEYRTPLERRREDAEEEESARSVKGQRSRSVRKNRPKEETRRGSRERETHDALILWRNETFLDGVISQDLVGDGIVSSVVCKHARGGKEGRVSLSFDAKLDLDELDFDEMGPAREWRMTQDSHRS